MRMSTYCCCRHLVIQPSPLYLLKHGKRRRDGNRHDPNDADQTDTARRQQPRLERTHDGQIAVDGDGRCGQCRHVDADAERHWHDVAQRLAERPRPEQPRERGERYRQQAHEDVGDGQVGDEKITWRRAHRTATCDNVNDERVAAEAEHKYDRVESRKDDNDEP